MKMTNKLNLPEPFVIYANKDSHEPKEHRYSVTELLLPTREILLNRRYYNDVEQDVSEVIPALFGTAVHTILESNTPLLSHLNSEMKIEMQFGEDTVAGRIDLFDSKELEIIDYKTCSTSKVMKKDFEDFRFQGLAYAYAIFKKYGLVTKRLKFPCLMKDWSKMKASVSTEYPQSPVYIWKYELQDSDYDYIEGLIKDKLREINDAIETGVLPECSDEEKWYTGTKYAVYKNVGDKKATYVADTEEDAHNYIRNKLGAAEIEVRKGEYLKCKLYCSCYKFCEKEAKK